jgi:SAM-dependent methyltransferase
MNFQDSRLSLRRSIWSYSKVQVLIGHLIRGRRFQLTRAAVDRPYLNLGCGDNARPEFLNVDYAWHRHVDVYWDVTRGLPFPDGKFSGAFTEHMLEHLPFENAHRVARDLWRVLRPGGRIRIVEPDGALYLKLYSEASSPAGGARFPYQDTDGFEGMYTPMR